MGNWIRAKAAAALGLAGGWAVLGVGRQSLGSGHNTAGLGLIRGRVLQVLLLSGHPIQKLQPWQGSKHSAHSEDDSVRNFGQHKNNEMLVTFGLQQQQNCAQIL